MTNLKLMILAARNVSEVSGDAIPYYELRCAVRPGITGWAQVRYGYANGLEEEVEKIRYDFYYLKHMSLWFDLRILFDTFKIVLTGRGAAGASQPGALSAVPAQQSLRGRNGGALPERLPTRSLL